MANKTGIPFEEFAKRLTARIDRAVKETTVEFASLMDEDDDWALAVLPDIVYRAATKMSLATTVEMEAVMLAGLTHDQAPSEVIDMLIEREMSRCTHNVGKTFEALFGVGVKTSNVRVNSVSASEHNAKVAEEIMAEARAAGEAH